MWGQLWFLPEIGEWDRLYLLSRVSQLRFPKNPTAEHGKSNFLRVEKIENLCSTAKIPPRRDYLHPQNALPPLYFGTRDCDIFCAPRCQNRLLPEVKVSICKYYKRYQVDDAIPVPHQSYRSGCSSHWSSPPTSPTAAISSLSVLALNTALWEQQREREEKTIEGSRRTDQALSIPI